jgi:MYXO-CTERM domain-containing protein
MPASCGGTPTGETMQKIKDYAGWTQGKNHFVILLTDGQPTCQDGMDGGILMWPPVPGPPTCVGGGPGTICDGRGGCECKNPTKVFDAIKTMHEKAIDTFVIGFEGSGTGTGCASGTGSSGKLPYNPDTLNMMATLGGQPAMGGTQYYKATDEATLTASLETIVGKLSGGTVQGCVTSGGGTGGAGSGGGTGGSGGRSGGSGGSSGGQGGSGGSGTAGQGGSDGGGSSKRAANSGGCACEAGPAGRVAGLFGGAFALLVAGGLVKRRTRQRNR